MSTQNPYLKKIQELAVQAVVNDLVHEKEEGYDHTPLFRINGN